MASPSSSSSANAVVELNVGGTRFTTTRATLTTGLAADSYFSALLSERFAASALRDASGTLFVDRSPSMFACVLEFLRSSLLLLPRDVDANALLVEARFYCVQPMIDALEREYAATSASAADAAPAAESDPHRRRLFLSTKVGVRAGVGYAYVRRSGSGSITAAARSLRGATFSEAYCFLADDTAADGAPSPPPLSPTATATATATADAPTADADADADADRSPPLAPSPPPALRRGVFVACASATDALLCLRTYFKLDPLPALVSESRELATHYSQFVVDTVDKGRYALDVPTGALTMQTAVTAKPLLAIAEGDRLHLSKTAASIDFTTYVRVPLTYHGDNDAAAAAVAAAAAAAAPSR